MPTGLTNVGKSCICRSREQIRDARAQWYRGWCSEQPYLRMNKTTLQFYQYVGRVTFDVKQGEFEGAKPPLELLGDAVPAGVLGGAAPSGFQTHT